MELDTTAAVGRSSLRVGTAPARLWIEDLSVYEAHGGHTLRRHVYPDPSADAQRLATEPHIHGAGTFLDAQTAEWAVDTTLRAHRAEILDWLRRGARGSDVAAAAFTRPVGSELTRDAWLRGQTAPAPASGVRVVMRRCDSLRGGFLVLTAYPVLVFGGVAAVRLTREGGRVSGLPNGLDVEAMRSQPGQEYPALAQFLGGYFHQDWGLEHAGWAAAVDAFREEADPLLLKQSAAELAALLGLGLSDADLSRLLAGLDCNVAPVAEGMTTTAWLSAVARRLQEPA